MSLLGLEADVGVVSAGKSLARAPYFERKGALSKGEDKETSVIASS